MIISATLIIFAYLTGSLSSAIIVCKLFGAPDPRTTGSNNPGTTNVLRIAGKTPAILTLLGDVLKGVIPVLVAKLFGLHGYAIAWVALAAFLGHLFPIFFSFKGGKGVATALGAMIALAWPVGLAMIATWLLVAGIFRYSSLAAIIMALLAPLYTWLLSDQRYCLAVIIISTILVIRHHTNIRRLLEGSESKIGNKS